jgi:hypothetical protein
MRAAKCGLMTVLVTGGAGLRPLVPAPRQCSTRRDGARPRLADLPGQGVWNHGGHPAIIFSEPAGAAEKGTGQRFNSADGRSTFTIYALEKAGGDTPASYLRKNLRMPRSALDYERVTRSFSPSPWSGRARCSTAAATSQAATAARCIASTWSTRRTWLGPGDGIVTRISRSLRPLEG